MKYVIDKNWIASCAKKVKMKKKKRTKNTNGIIDKSWITITGCALWLWIEFTSPLWFNPDLFYLFRVQFPEFAACHFYTIQFFFFRYFSGSMGISHVFVGWVYPRSKSWKND